MSASTFPECDGVPAFTKLFGAGSIYCITPCSEETAKRAIASFRKVPFYEFSATSPPRISGPEHLNAEDGINDFDQFEDDDE